MKPTPLEISFTPADNQRLANLCGALDENLKQVETALDVTISRRGEHFSVSGKSGQTALAAQALRNFYNQSQHHLSLEQIQLGLIEVQNPRNTPDNANEEQGDSGGAKLPAAPTLLTRRSNLYGRTPRQVQYLQQILKYQHRPEAPAGHTRFLTSGGKEADPSLFNNVLVLLDKTTAST